MKITQLLCCGVATLAALSLTAVEPVNVPYKKVSGAAGSVKNLNIPWQTDFKILGSSRPAVPGTRYKLAHDNYNLYIAVIAEEPDTKLIKLREKTDKEDFDAWRTDSLDLNFIPKDEPEKFYQVIITANGVFNDNSGEDDNTGTETYVSSPAWASNVKVISSEIGKDFWSVEAAIPLGSLRTGSSAATSDLSVIVGRVRFAGLSRYESSANVISKRNVFLSPPVARPMVLENFDKKFYRWQLDKPIIKCSKRDGKLFADISTAVINRTDKRANARIKVTLRDRAGKEYVVMRGCSGVVNTIAKTELSVELDRPGKYTARVELFDGRKRQLAEQIAEMVLDYQPVKIQVTSPSYRNNIYASQQVDNIEAVITLEENIGKPLTVTLKGKNVDLKQVIPAAQKVNKVVFPTKGMVEGEYTLAANSAKTVIRKLAAHPNEVWFDKNGITYLNGKPFLVNGYFGLQATHNYPGMNMIHTYAYNFKSPEHLIGYLDKAHAANLKVMLPPYVEFFGQWQLKYFSKPDRQKSKLDDNQKKVLARLVSVIKNHPAFFGYYAADEPEGHGFNPDWQKDLKEYLAEIDPYHPVIMLNYGLDGVRMFAEGGDILMPDCYVDYYMDGTTAKKRRASYDFARLANELGTSGYLVPQAFDFSRINPNGAGGRSPSFDELRQQNMLGFLGDAKGIVPYALNYRGMATYGLREAPFVLGAEIDALKDLLIQPTDNGLLKSDRSIDEIMAGVKRYKDKAIVIAVSVSDNPFTAKIKVPDYIKGRLAVSGEKRFVEVKDGFIIDSFEPQHTHVYIMGDLKSDSIDLAATRNKIAEQEKSRRKPGNLLASGGLTFRQMQDYAKGIVPAGVPYIKGSTSIAQWPYSACGECWLQDGIIEEVPRDYNMYFGFQYGDQKRFIDIDFGKEVTVGRVVFYSIMNNSTAAFAAARVLDENGKVLGEIKNNTQHKSEVTFAPVKLRKLRIDSVQRRAGARLFTELEVYAK